MIAWIALLSPPNTADAMAYHLPRVVYWVQNRSVAFFSTPYLNQIMLQPVAEYMMLQTWLLSGGDRFVNLVQWIGFCGSVVGVSSIAGALGLTGRGQVYAALFCATLPNGILQASGAKNDYVLALWLVCLILFVIRWVETGALSDLIFVGLAAGLALGTKGTAYLFAPPCALAAWLAAGGLRSRALPATVAAIVGTLFINGPQYARNYNLSGSILGFDSAFGDGSFRWRNERLGWKPAVSNLLRNTSDQLGGRSDAQNQAVYRTVLRLHSALGIDANDPDTTWPWAQYQPPRNDNHEADANNRWHLLLLLIAAGAAAYWWIARRQARWLIYAAGPICGFAAFCVYLKWQPYFVRLELPLFVVSAPLAAALLDSLRPAMLQIAVCIFLLTTARLPLLQNWTRRLQGPNSLLVTARDRNYFNDMVQWHNTDSYFAAVDRIAATGCTTIGIDINRNQLEYPLQALLRERNPAVRFVHMGVKNVSARYATEPTPQPCAILCPDCAGIPEKEAQYRALGPPLTIGRFVLFLRK